MHSFTYNDIQANPFSPSTEWTIIPETQGSDYNGSSVTRSNFEYMRDSFNASDDLAVVYGWFFGYGIAYRTASYQDETMDTEIREIIDSLTDYPVVCEDHLSRLEIRWQDEALESWALDDFRRAVESSHGIDTSDVSDDTMIRVFYVCADEANEYWRSQHADMWIDVDRLAAVFPDVIASFPVVA